MADIEAAIDNEAERKAIFEGNASKVLGIDASFEA
jgi:predicted TIM-barrel fold metal-dependent hydrolase